MTQATTSSSPCDSVRNWGRGALETIGIVSSDEPVTAESLAKQKRSIIITGLVSAILLILGVLGQIGILPMGSTLVSLSLILGTAGLLLTAVATYTHWKRQTEFDSQGSKPDKHSGVATVKSLWNRGSELWSYLRGSSPAK